MTAAHCTLTLDIEGPDADLTCCQLSPRAGDLRGNVRRAATAIGAAAATGAELIVLPELATSGYPDVRPADVAAAAVPGDDPLLRAWAEQAGAATVVGGFCELGADGTRYNSAAVLDASGVRAVYRKSHLGGAERDVFTPGNDGPPVLETPAGRIGVLVCYDMEFPELTRAVALAGADVLAVPTNWPLVARPAGERPPEVVIAMAAARVNRVAVTCCDRAGQGWTGGTSIIDPGGWVVATASTAADTSTAEAEIDIAACRDKSTGPANHALEDRRPELYASLTLDSAATTRQDRP